MPLVRTLLAGVASFFWMVSAFAQDRITFPSNDADVTKGPATVLTGLLYRPAGDGPFPAVVLLHGCSGLYRPDGRTLTARHDDWAQRLHHHGYVVLHVDSFGPRGLGSICSIKERSIRASIERARDAYGALLYLQSLPFVRRDRIGLMGWSHGGITTLWTIRTGSAARPRGLAHDFRAAVAFYPGCRDALASGLDWGTRIPLMLLVGEKDDWTAPAPCVELAARSRGRGQPVEIVVYPDAYHDFDAPAVPLRKLANIATTESGTATVGTNPAARADTLERVPGFFAQHLRN